MTTDKVVADRPPYSQIPHTLTRDTSLSLSARVVYDDLMARADHPTGNCFPGIRTIANDIGVSTSTAQKAVNDLEAAGWITITRMGRKKDGDGKGQLIANRYHVHIEPVAKSATGVSRNTRQGRRDNRDVTRTTELEPVNKNQLAAKPRNVGWDFYTDPQGFNLPTGTATQQKRVGRLAREVNATIDHCNIGGVDELNVAALAWPMHFPDATLTPEAYAKHLPALLTAPLRGTRHAVKQATRAADDEALAARLAEVVP